MADKKKEKSKTQEGAESLIPAILGMIPTIAAAVNNAGEREGTSTLRRNAQGAGAGAKAAQDSVNRSTSEVLSQASGVSPENRLAALSQGMRSAEDISSRGADQVGNVASKEAFFANKALGEEDIRKKQAVGQLGGMLGSGLSTLGAQLFAQNAGDAAISARKPADPLGAVPSTQDQQAAQQPETAPAEAGQAVGQSLPGQDPGAYVPTAEDEAFGQQLDEDFYGSFGTLDDETLALQAAETDPLDTVASQFDAGLSPFSEEGAQEASQMFTEGVYGDPGLPPEQQAIADNAVSQVKEAFQNPNGRAEQVAQNVSRDFAEQGVEVPSSLEAIRAKREQQQEVLNNRLAPLMDGYVEDYSMYTEGLMKAGLAPANSFLDSAAAAFPNNPDMQRNLLEQMMLEKGLF